MSGAPADLSEYATHFNELETADCEIIVDLNAINPLSELRDDWQNASTNKSEHQLTTAANTNDLAYLESEERGQYTAGFMCQAGIGVRLPSAPTGDSTVRWGYYETDSNGDPTNGFWFGQDSNGVFVARAHSGTVERVYQDSWNRDRLGDYDLNPSGRTLDLTDGLVFRIDFTYYGYGPIEMRVLLPDDDDDNYGSSDLTTVHTFNVTGSTSTDNTNLPLRTEIDSDGTSNDALDLYVGGRAFSVLGQESTNTRITGHYLGSLSAVDDTKWYHAISFKIKDGSENIGSGIDFSHIVGQMRQFSADADTTVYRWQIRRGTVPNNPLWENPFSAEDKPDETAFKVDTNSADVQDGSGNLTGVHIDGGVLEEGQKNESNIKDADLDGQVVSGQVVSLLFKAKPAQSGTISEIYFKIAGQW